jgi:hypothetical protein
MNRTDVFVFVFKQAMVFYTLGYFYQFAAMDHDDTECVYTWRGLMDNTRAEWSR